MILNKCKSCSEMIDKWVILLYNISALSFIPFHYLLSWNNENYDIYGEHKSSDLGQ